MALCRFLFISPYVRAWDEVDFVLALDRFDLLAMQPHFPGYPYFILGGMLVHRFVADPVKALALWNTGMAVLAALPVYLLARRSWGPGISLLVMLAAWTPAYLWVLSAQPMSEATAVAVLWWYLWSLRRGMERDSTRARWLLPLLLFGLLMGVRLSYAPFGLGLCLLAWLDRKQRPGAYPSAWFYIAGLGLAFQLVWVAALAWSEGGLASLLSLTWGFVGGHFTDWGGSVASSPMGLGERTLLLLFRNWLWIGVLGQSWFTAAAWAGLAAVLFWGRRQSGRTAGAARQPLSPDERRFRQAVAVMLLAYGLWALLGQNIDKPRHIAPLIGAFVYLLAAGALRRRRWPAAAALAVLAASQALTGAQLIRQQAAEKPAVVQLADYLRQGQGQGGPGAGGLRAPQGFMLYTWEESRVLSYLGVPFPHHSIQTFGLFREQVRIRPEGQRVLLTDHVLQGFEAQGELLEGRVRPLAEFDSTAMFEPVYHHIKLYEWENLVNKPAGGGPEGPE